MTITYGETAVTIDNPEFGYEVLIMLSTYWEQQDDNTWKVWDDGSSYDYRTLKCLFMLDATKASNLIDVFDNVNKGRNRPLVIVPDSGFFPAGPDKGDAGAFFCRLLSYTERPVIMQPVKYFPIDCTFAFTGNFPANALPSEEDEGSLQIGTVSGLRYPENNHELANSLAVDVVLTQNGTPYGLDHTTTSDYQQTTLPMIMNESKAAALTSYLTGASGRASAFNIVAPANSYMFGRAIGANGTYSVLFIQNEIRIVHEKHNRFTSNFTFFYNG